MLCLLYSKTELRPDTSLMLQFITHSQGTKTWMFYKIVIFVFRYYSGLYEGPLSPSPHNIMKQHPFRFCIKLMCVDGNHVKQNKK